MKEPNKRQLRAIRRLYNQLIAEAQAKCITGFQEVRAYAFSRLSEIKNEDKLYKTLEGYIVQQYSNIFLGLKADIVKNYNQSGIIEADFTGKTLGRNIPYTPTVVKVLPATTPFEITNKILSEKSILKRSKIMAKQVTSAIAESLEQGATIQATQKKIDIIMGFRNAQGQINEKAKALILQGKFCHRNGHIYQTYRIARTETMRMASLRTHEIFSAIEREDKRLKLFSVIDSRTRWQSAIMNGQISDEKGRFKYPDGIYYKLGEQPKQWSINDRETQVVVFLENPKTAKELKAQNTAKLKDFKQFYEETKGVAQALRNSMPASKISTNYLKENITPDLRKHYVIAGYLNDTVKNLLSSETNELRLSFDNLVKNQAKHPEINYSLYSKVSSLINNYDKYYYNRGNLIIEKMYQGNNLLIALKTTKNKAENYFLSVYMANHNKKQ